MTPGQGMAPYLDQFGYMTGSPPAEAWQQYGLGPQALFHAPFALSQPPAQNPAQAAPAAMPQLPTPGSPGGVGQGGRPQDRTREDILNDALGRGYAPFTGDNLLAAFDNALGLKTLPGRLAAEGLINGKVTGGITGNTNQLTPSAQAALRRALDAAVPQTGPIGRMRSAAHSFDPRGVLRGFERDTRMAANTGGLSGAFKKDAQYGPGTDKGGNDRSGRRDSAQSRDARGGSAGRHGRGDTRGGRSGF